jgi:hypothetical protein
MLVLPSLFISFNQPPAMYKIILGIALVLAFASCEKEKRECPSSTEKTFSETGFTRISAGETFALKITQGTAFSIKAKGCSNDLSDLALTIAPGGTLDIHYNRYQSDRYRVDLEITLPTLSSLILSGAATATIDGFAQQTTAMRTVVSGTAKAKLNQLPVLVKADLSGSSELTLVGTASDLIATLGGESRLNAYTATVNDADVYTSGTAKAYVLVQQSLAALASGDSRIYYKGTPGSVNIEQSGTARVIHE